MKSILFINASSLPIPATSGGAVQQVIGNIISVLKSHFDITVLTPCTEDSKKESTSEKYEGINWININRKLQSGGIKGILNSRKIISGELKKLEKENFSHAIIFDPYLAPIIKRWNRKVEVIWSAHNGRSRTKLFLNLWANNIDKVASISDFLRRSIEKDIGFALKKPTHKVIFNPINSEWIYKDRKYKKQEFSLFFCGRIVPEKGLDVLIKSINLLDDDLKRKITFGIAGGSHFQNSEETSYTKGIREMLEKSDFKYKIYGFVDHDDLIDLYDQYDVLIIPSNWDEPATLVASEGQLRGCKIVASNAGGLPEMIYPSWKKYIVPKGDHLQLKNSIEKIITNVNDDLDREKGRQWVIDQFNENRLLNEWKSILS